MKQKYYTKKQNLLKSQIIEYSILFIITKYFEVASNKIHELENLSFMSSKNENLKTKILELISQEEKNILLIRKLKKIIENSSRK